MKKFILLQTCLLIAILGFSQGPVLTMYNSAPVPGDCFLSYLADTTGVVAGDPGANMTWDYSNLNIGTEMVYEIYQDTTYVSFTNFPNFTTLYGAGNTYYFLNISDSAYRMVGEAHYPGALYMGPDRLLNYSDPATIMRYPMSYPLSFTDHYAAYSSAMFTEIFREGVTSTKADGYGKLILPFTTINNVIRMRITTDNTDSTIVSLFNTTSVVHSHDVKYLWYDGITKTPVLVIEYPGNHSSAFNQTSVRVAAWMAGAGDRNSCKPVFSVYPNPASNNLHVSFILAGQTDVTFALLTVTGNELLRVPAEALSPGNHKQCIDISGIPGGLYILKCTAGKESTFHKIFVE